MMNCSLGSGGIAHRFNWRMMGTAMGSPTFIVPWANAKEPISPRSILPITRNSSWIAPEGQLRVQLPQP
jgi:hypothetical protein